MKNTFKYIIASVAALAFSLPVFAAADEPDNWNAIKVNKTATANSDGSYTLTLDTFVTGEADSRITTTQPTPADIVLVLDVSGSMWFPMDANKLKETKDSPSTIYTNVTNGSKTYYVRTNASTASDISTYMSITSVTTGRNNHYYANVSGYNFGWDDGEITKANGTNAVAKCNDYSVYEGEGTRLAALKDGCISFINIIAGYTTEQVQNKISIVTFATSATTVKESKLASNDTYTGANSELKSAINSLSASGGTNASSGLDAASTILAKVTRTSKKSVIFFTDGEPNSESAAINSAKSLKPGVTVYSIGAFASASNDIRTFLSKVSSNYDNNGSNTGETKYSVIASNVDDLTSAFQEFAHDSEPDNTGGAGVQLETNDVTVRDIVTPHFVLPQGNSAIKLYVVKNTGIDVTKEESDTTRYSWDYATKFEPDSSVVKAKTVKGEDGTTIDVTGFDFSANWVGYHVTYKNDKETGRTLNEGYKLQIVITVLPDPEKEGGPVTTNDPDSGVYVDGKNNGEPVANYDVPPTQFTPMDLKITKTGLKAGDSTIFTITRTDGDGIADSSFSMTVVLTSVGEGVSTTLTKLPVNDDNGKPYTYKVVETGWAWNYTNAAASSNEHALYTIENDEYKADNVFSFTASQESAATNNAEAYKKNEFNTRN